jgi:hypothetical protein
MGLAHAENPFPGFDVGGRMAGAWEDATLQRAAEEYLVAVDRELSAFGADFPHPEYDGPVDLPALSLDFGVEANIHSVKRGRNLVQTRRRRYSSAMSPVPMKKKKNCVR